MDEMFSRACNRLNKIYEWKEKLSPISDFTKKLNYLYFYIFIAKDLVHHYLF